MPEQKQSLNKTDDAMKEFNNAVHYIKSGQMLQYSYMNPSELLEEKHMLLAGSLWNSLYSALSTEQMNFRSNRKTTFYDDCDELPPTIKRVNFYVAQIIDALAHISREALQGKIITQENPLLQEISARMYHLGIKTNVGEKYKDINLKPLPPKYEILHFPKDIFVKKESTHQSSFTQYINTRNLAALGAAIGLFATGGLGGLAIGILAGSGVKPVVDAISSTCSRKTQI